MTRGKGKWSIYLNILLNVHRNEVAYLGQGSGGGGGGRVGVGDVARE